MFCGNCGTQIPDEASFCWKCGKPQKSGVQAPEPKWETCEIVREVVRKESLLSGAVFRWVAQAMGPKGQYLAGQSDTFKGTWNAYEWGSEPKRDDERTGAALKGLVDRLLKDGWESTGRGSEWYSQRFQRHVS
jgi:hypothetical protein